jgi:hypothetical protein
MMQDLVTDVDFIADLPLYKKEKPYYVFWAVGDTLPKSIPTTNLQLETHAGINISDIHGEQEQFTIEKQGFEILPHVSQLDLPIDSIEKMKQYKRETEWILGKRFNTIAAFCYEARVFFLLFHCKYPLIESGSKKRSN